MIKHSTLKLNYTLLSISYFISLSRFEAFYSKEHIIKFAINPMLPAITEQKNGTTI